MQRVNEEWWGNFGGVGVQFYKYLDTVTVVKVVPVDLQKLPGCRMVTGL